jgi:hypothetical protein
MEIQVVLEEEQVHIKHQVVEEQVNRVVPRQQTLTLNREDMVVEDNLFQVLNIH